MLTRFVALVCCVALSACYLPAVSGAGGTPSPGSLAYMDAKAGFRDVRFGMSVADIADLTAVQDEAGLQVYRRASDSLTLGNGVLSSIKYGFKAGRLVMISLTADGSTNSTALLEAFQAAYGEGYKPNRFMKDYFWSGQLVQTTYSQRPGKADSWLTISDKAFMEQELKDRAHKSANADL